MDFDYRKPLHILALLLIISSIFIIFISQIMTFFSIPPFDQPNDYESLGQGLNLMLEAVFLVFYLLFSFVFFILFPLLWYIFVNSLSFKKALSKIRITLENIDIAFLWGILTVFIIFGVTFILEFALEQSGADMSDLSNIPDLEALFSPAILFFLVAIMPVAEEIFFRGFLMEKFEGFAGKNFAIVMSAVLFGIAHMGYGKIYPVIMPIIMGLLLGYIVVKTRNLFASIIAHVTFNVVVIFLYFAFKSFV